MAVSEQQPSRSWAISTEGVTSWADPGRVRRAPGDDCDNKQTARWGAVARRVAKSFRCRPSAAGERTVGDIPMVLDLDPAWVQLPSTPSQLQLTDGTALVMARAVSVPTKSEHQSEHLVAALSAAGIFVDPKFSGRVGDDWPIETIVKDQKRRGFLRVQLCPDGSQALLVYVGRCHRRRGGWPIAARARALPQERRRSPGLAPIGARHNRRLTGSAVRLCPLD